MSETEYKSLEETLLELEKTVPNVPLLALGQTIFWDEPMKAGVALKLKKLGLNRKFVAGIHDSDYFAKIQSGRGAKGKFKTFPHNDTTTKGLWSAAGEFSALFGSETVITRENLAAAGVRVDRVLEARPKFLDEITEAWGWRGIVSLDNRPPVTAELPIGPLLPELMNTFQWAADLTLQSLAGQGLETARELIEGLETKMCEVGNEESSTLATFYRKLLPTIYEFVANVPVQMETAATTELLRFNRSTCGQPRFKLVEPFVNSATRTAAVHCYDEAIKGSPGLYELSRFGTGSIPFDMIIPGNGRGTVRLGTKGAVIMTPKLEFLSFKKPLTSLEEFAGLVEDKFGPNCSLVGKAVSLIGMLGKEFIFVFHEGASSYVRYSRKFHNLLQEKIGFEAGMNPLLRVRYSAWSALGVCCSWLRLPEVLQRPFGTEELCAPSFAARWQEVGEEHQQLLVRLGKIKRPIELVRYLDATLGGSWKKLAEEYSSLEGRLKILRGKLGELGSERDGLYRSLKTLRQLRVAAERASGEQFRSEIFEQIPSEEALYRRQEHIKNVKSRIHDVYAAEESLRDLRRRQHSLAEDVEVKSIHDRRRSIEIEAEMKRARLVRGAIVASKGLAQASVRPSAWWFPLVCPDGLWFRETIETATAYIEPLEG